MAKGVDYEAGDLVIRTDNGTANRGVLGRVLERLTSNHYVVLNEDSKEEQTWVSDFFDLHTPSQTIPELPPPRKRKILEELI